MSRQRLFSAGSNVRGQLATGDIEDAMTFTSCRFARDAPPIHILDIASGANHTLLLGEFRASPDGPLIRGLWGCGDGSRGQLGHRYQQDLMQNGGTTSMFRVIDLGLEEKGLEKYVVDKIAASWETSFVVLKSTSTSITFSSLPQSDVLLSMGANDYGDLGIGVESESIQGARSSKGKARAVGHGPHIVTFNNVVNTYLIPPRITIGHIACGPHHTVAALQVLDGKIETILVGWGASRHGQLGKRAGQHSCQTQPVYLYRRIAQSQLGIKSLALGAQHSVYHFGSGTILGMGSNKRGQLAALPLIEQTAIKTCATWHGTYILLQIEDSKRQIKASGSHNKGQLGFTYESPDLILDKPRPIPLSLFIRDDQRLDDVKCGSEHVLATVLDLDKPDATEVWGWGWNEHGNLGVGDTENASNPVRIYPPAQGVAPIEGVDPTKCTVKSIWAGCGTSWVLFEEKDAADVAAK